MKATGRSKTIQGKKTQLVELETLKKKVTKFGKGGAHITMPRMHLGREVEVKVLSPRPFICKGCMETISREEHFSPEKELCMFCYREKQAMKAGKCISCGGPNPKKEQWAQCDKCFGDKSYQYREEEGV